MTTDLTPGKSTLARRRISFGDILLSPLAIAILCGVISAIVLSYDGLAEAVRRWGTQEEYSHGYLIPLVSLYILWEKRFDLAEDLKPGSWWGLPVVVLALIIQIVGEISAIYVLVQYAFLLYLVGLSLCAIGAAAKHTLIPIALLGFAIPLPYFLEAVLTAQMQLWSSELGVQIIRWLNIPVFLSGNVIDLGSYKLQVVEACSGLSYLFPLMCLGFIGAYFYQARLWKRALLFLSTIPITIFMNSFRIGVTGVLVDRWGVQMAEGFLHDFEGWIIFMGCALVLVLEIKLLERLTTRKGVFDVFGLQTGAGPALAETDKAAVAPLRARITIPRIAPVMLAIVLTGAAATGVLAIDQRREVLVENVNLARFPERVGNWQGSHGSIDSIVLKALQVTDYLMMNFEAPGEPMVNFYVAYYASQRKGVSPHSPRVCIPGGGWEITGIRRISVDGLPVNRVMIQRGLEAQLVYYWFQERGTPVANEYLKKWMLLRDAFALNRTDGALVRITTPVLPADSNNEADIRLKNFMLASYPELRSALPGTNLEY